MPDAADPTAENLTGLWHGQYSYPTATRAPVPFTANLIEAEDSIGGSITERAMVGKAGSRTLYATISGRRSGSSVSFMKIYEAHCGPYTSVAYHGALSEDGLEIGGEWIAAGWSGRFLMIRASGLKSVARKKIAAKV
jgi:hypothetical protein